MTEENKQPNELLISKPTKPYLAGVEESLKPNQIEAIEQLGINPDEALGIYLYSECAVARYHLIQHPNSTLESVDYEVAARKLADFNESHLHIQPDRRPEILTGEIHKIINDKNPNATSPLFTHSLIINNLVIPKPLSQSTTNYTPYLGM